MGSLKKEMGSLFPGKVQKLLNAGCTKSGSYCTEDSDGNTKKQGHKTTFLVGKHQLVNAVPTSEARVKWKQKRILG